MREINVKRSLVVAFGLMVGHFVGSVNDSSAIDRDRVPSTLYEGVPKDVEITPPNLRESTGGDTTEPAKIEKKKGDATSRDSEKNERRKPVYRLGPGDMYAQDDNGSGPRVVSVVVPNPHWVGKKNTLG